MYQIQCTKNEVFHKDFFRKWDQIRSFLWICSHLLKKSLMENFIFCVVIAAEGVPFPMKIKPLNSSVALV